MKRRARSKDFVITDTAGFWGRPAATALLIVISFALMILSTVKPGVLQGARNGAVDITMPVIQAVAQPVQNFTLSIRDITGLASIQAEMAALRAENEALRGWRNAAVGLQAENQTLRQMLNLPVDPAYNCVSARVMADPGNAYVKSVLVDAGATEGVQKGHAVVSGDGLVGRIIESGERGSRILLVNDVNSRIPVILKNSGVHAVLSGGQGDLVARLDHLPNSIVMAEEDVVLTSGRGGVFPPGLPIGAITKDSELVRLFADFDRLQFVRILDHTADPNLKKGALN